MIERRGVRRRKKISLSPYTMPFKFLDIHLTIVDAAEV